MRVRGTFLTVRWGFKGRVRCNRSVEQFFLRQPMVTCHWFPLGMIKLAYASARSLARLTGSTALHPFLIALHSALQLAMLGSTLIAKCSRTAFILMAQFLNRGYIMNFRYKHGQIRKRL